MTQRLTELPARSTGRRRVLLARPPRRRVESFRGDGGGWRAGRGGYARTVARANGIGHRHDGVAARDGSRGGRKLAKGAAPSEGDPGSAGAASRDGSSMAVIVLAAPAAGSWPPGASFRRAWLAGSPPFGVVLAKVRLATPAGFPCSATLLDCLRKSGTKSFKL